MIHNQNVSFVALKEEDKKIAKGNVVRFNLTYHQFPGRQIGK